MGKECKYASTGGNLDKECTYTVDCRLIFSSWTGAHFWSDFPYKEKKLFFKVLYD
jgi:hypothetical protein